MRRRLLFSTLAVAVVAVFLLGVPLSAVVNRLVRDEARQGLQAESRQLVVQVEGASVLEAPLDREQISRAHPDRYIEITAPEYGHVTVGKPPPPDEMIRESAHSVNGVRVSVAMDSRQVDEESRGAMVLIAAVGSVAIAVAVGLAIVQSRRLTLPLEDLAKIADRLGSGDARPSRHRYGIVELDRVAEVLDRSAVRISDLLAVEREFATDASHQLRTPLTGLTMRLEEIVAAADHPEVVREEGEAAIVQVERLTAVINELLATARRQRQARAGPIDVDTVLEQQLKEWETAFRHAGRGLKLVGTRGLTALATPGGLGQVISTLLENSLRHGGGQATITTSSGERSVVIEVEDEGQGVPEEMVSRVFERGVSGGGGTGLGLVLARALVAADGGRLELVRPRPAAFAVFLRPDGETRNRVVSGPA
ncbi:ATP-binding protein [Rhizohabitans arisaemae]|uniref:ATP-binding protein n=1 Tax=Rhizohabitans arisaemae TaxID=2720610 RepID=UPI0024B2179A|nr:ATP-binding protein [Rhizohabitans arisaemae]